MIVLTIYYNSGGLFDEKEDFVAFLEADMVVEMIVLYYTIIR